MAKCGGRKVIINKVITDSVNLDILDKADLKKSGRIKSVGFNMDKQLKRDDKI